LRFSAGRRLVIGKHRKCYHDRQHGKSRTAEKAHKDIPLHGKPSENQEQNMII
jgi:hypothetical protein